MGDVYCKNHITKDKACGFSTGNCKCRFVHKWFNEMPVDHQQKWCQFIDTTPGLSLAPGIKRPAAAAAAPASASATTPPPASTPAAAQE